MVHAYFYWFMYNEALNIQHSFTLRTVAVKLNNILKPKKPIISATLS